MADQKIKLIDYKNVRVSLLSSVICFLISNVLAFAAIGSSIASVKDDFSAEAFDARLQDLGWVNRLADTFNILFFITLIYLLIQIVQYYQGPGKK